MKNKMHSLLLVLWIFTSGCASRSPLKPVGDTSKNQTSKSTQNTKNQDQVKIKEKITSPKVASEIIMIDHKYFKIAYDPSKRLAQFVTYQLTASQLINKSSKRKNKFIADPYLVKKKIPYVVTDEYAKSGYDRGHLAPSADFMWNQEANNKTFVMSNMAPQLPGLNRDAWKKLEDQVRKWACGEEKVTVITGPIFSDNLPTLKSGLVIPKEFFKVVIDETPPKKMISFVYHQTDKGNVLTKRVVPMRTIELATGIAFNHSFPELTKGNIRAPANLDEWKEADCW